MQRRNPQKTKKKILPACTICGLWESFCVCPLLPRINSRVEILLIQHSSELLRQSNTGRLVAKMVTPSEIISWGAAGIPFNAAALKKPDTNYLILYPGSSTRVLEPEDVQGPRGEKTCLVLLDATWGQARSMSRRIPQIQGLPFLSLPQEQAPVWKLRRSPAPGYCCTLEATIRALSVIHGNSLSSPLLLALELVMARSLHMRGKITKNEMEEACEPVIERLLPS